MKKKKHLFTAMLITGLAVTTAFPGAVSALSDEFSDGAFLQESTESPDTSAVFSSGTNENPNEDFDTDLNENSDKDFSDDFTLDDSLDTLMDNEASPGENTVILYYSGDYVGTFSTLDDAMECITDPDGNYHLQLSEGIYDMNLNFPEAESISMEYSGTKTEGNFLDCALRIIPSETNLQSNLSLDSVSLLFASPNGTFHLGNNSLVLRDNCLIKAQAETDTDKFSITGESNSRITMDTWNESGIYGAELNIGTLDFCGRNNTISSNNAAHSIQNLNLSGSGNLYFVNNGAASSSANNITFQHLQLKSSYSLLFSERFDCTFGSFGFSDNYKLTLCETAATPLPQWGTITFSEGFPSQGQLLFEYMIDSDQDCSDPEKTFFTQDQILIIAPDSPNRQDLTVRYCWSRDKQVVASSSRLLSDNGTGNYHPDINYQFYYDQLQFTKKVYPKLGKKVGKIAVALDSALADKAAVVDARWISPDQLSTFKQGQTYYLTVKVANRQGVLGKFTGQEKATLTLGKKTIAGTVQVSDDNTLTIQFPYTIDRAASLPKTTLKSAKCLTGTSARVTWAKISGVSGYKILRKTAKTSWKTVKIINSPSRVSYKDTKLKPGETYYYTIQAFKRNPDGTTTRSKYNTGGLSVKLVISAPKLLSAKLTSYGPRIRWKRVNGASSYKIYRRTDSTDWQYLHTAKSSVRILYDNTITAPGTYYYTVQGIRGKVNGSYNQSGIKLTVPKLSTPVITSATWQTNSYNIRPSLYALLKWKPVEDAQYYCVMRRQAGTSDWTVLDVVPASDEPYYHDYNVGLATSYYYTVCPAIAEYYGPYSSTGIYLKKYLNL